MYVDPEGTSFLVTLIVGVIVGVVIGGVIGGVDAAQKGENFWGGVASGALVGGVLSGAMVLGGTTQKHMISFIQICNIHIQKVRIGDGASGDDL